MAGKCADCGKPVPKGDNCCKECFGKPPKPRGGGREGSGRPRIYPNNAEKQRAYRARLTGRCAWCNAPFEGRVTRAYCSPACKVAAWRKGVRTGPGAMPGRFSILDRDGFRCRYCGRSAREDSVKLHVDHVVPLSKNGSSEPDNLVTACQDCNLGKNDRTLISPVP